MTYVLGSRYFSRTRVNGVDTLQKARLPGVGTYLFAAVWVPALVSDIIYLNICKLIKLKCPIEFLLTAKMIYNIKETLVLYVCCFGLSPNPLDKFWTNFQVNRCSFILEKRKQYIFYIGIPRGHSRKQIVTNKKWTISIQQVSLNFVAV